MGRTSAPVPRDTPASTARYGTLGWMLLGGSGAHCSLHSYRSPAGSSPLSHALLPQNLVRWCDSSPCKNGGKCWQTSNLYHCECNSGWTGLYCDVPSVSCEVAAKQQGKALPCVQGQAGLPRCPLCWALGRDVAGSLGGDLWHGVISRIALGGSDSLWDVWWPGHGPVVRRCHQGPCMSLCSP